MLPVMPAATRRAATQLAMIGLTMAGIGAFLLLFGYLDVEPLDGPARLATVAP